MNSKEDSLSMYLKMRQDVSNKVSKLNSMQAERVDNCRKLAVCVLQEMFSVDEGNTIKGLSDSTLVAEISKIQDNAWNSDISKSDALVFLQALESFMRTEEYSFEDDEDIKKVFLLRKESSRVDYYNSILETLENLDDVVRNINSTLPIICKVTGFLPSKRDQANAATEGFEKQQDSDRSMMQKALQSDWMNAQKNYVDSLRALQPDLTKMLNVILNIAKETDEQYVIRFAELQLELYNLIYDEYIAQRELAYKSNNQNYINAVENYLAHMDAIADSLSAFGVEELCSNPGDNYDSHIHEAVDKRKIAGRSQHIVAHLRSGFRYKKTVVQKELVDIK